MPRGAGFASGAGASGGGYKKGGEVSEEEKKAKRKGVIKAAKKKVSESGLFAEIGKAAHKQDHRGSPTFQAIYGNSKKKRFTGNPYFRHTPPQPGKGGGQVYGTGLPLGQ